MAIRDEALPRLERAGDARLQLDARLGLVEVLTRRGEHDAALQLLTRQILPWAQRLGEIGIVGRARVQRVELLTALGQPEEVLRAQQDDVRAFSELLREPAVVANVQALITVMLHELDHQSDEALRRLREGMLPLVQRSGDVRAAAVVQHNIARILTARGLLDEALRVYQAEVLPVFRRLGEKRLVAETLNEIAGVYLGQGRRRKALRLFKDELAPLVADLGDKYLQTRLSSRLVQLFSAMGRLDEALHLLQAVVLPWLREHGPAGEALAEEAFVVELQLRRGKPEDLAAARTSLPNIEAAAQAQGLTELLKKVQPMMSTLGIAPTAPPSPSERTKG
ncbi:MAG: tetratricopeptide repeat protein [Deltaproteobacteria bacterium]|nr:tetratricopeptide repeat protein [Deltaproteobacteria bacterium]